MPELDLSGKEVLDWQDSLKVLAVMLYPKDQGAREEYMIRFKADKYLCLGLPDEQIMLPLTKLLAPLGGFRALSEGPSYSEIELQAIRHAQHGIVAGDILANIIRLARYDFDGSVHRAIQVMETYLPKHAGVLNLPGKFPTKHAAIKAAWAEYKSVAHLWLAWRSVASQDRKLSPYPAEILPLFLASANCYRHWSESYIPPQGKITTLAPEETWKIHTSFPLPDIRIEIRPVTDAQVKAIGL